MQGVHRNVHLRSVLLKADREGVHADYRPLGRGRAGKDGTTVLEHLRELLAHYPCDLAVLFPSEVRKVTHIDKRNLVEIQEILAQLLSPGREGPGIGRGIQDILDLCVCGSAPGIT